MNSLENLAQSQNNKEIEDINKFNDDLKKLRRGVLKYGLQITPEYFVINPTNDNSDKHYNATLSALTDLRNNLQLSQNSIGSIRVTIKDRRIFYTIKCLDSQNQLRALISLLEDAKKKYSRRSWFLNFVNKIT